MEEALIRVIDLCKIYNPGENEVRALDHINLEINKGEFVAIIGQSGSGKSTFMNMLGCLDVPTSGEYFLNGTDVSTMEDNELSEVRNREIGFIFQGFNLISNLTAIENVELPLVYRGVDRKTRHKLAVESLTMVGLEKRMDHRPNEMSGGQQQRVAIARAIAAQPPVILADEPTGNLDSASSKEILQILKSMHEQGKTVILITHDNGIAAQARRVVRIMDGKIESDFINKNYGKEEYIKNLYEKLKSGTYVHGKYSAFKVYEPKERIIEKAPYIDRIVHRWIVDNFLAPYYVPSFIKTTYACIKDRRNAQCNIRFAIRNEKNEKSI